jgi:hypothetical protein
LDGTQRGTQRSTKRGTQRNAKEHKGARKGKQRKARVEISTIDPRLPVLLIYKKLFIPKNKKITEVVGFVWTSLLLQI